VDTTETIFPEECAKDCQKDCDTGYKLKPVLTDSIAHRPRVTVIANYYPS
jgi:hypothetical protein